MSGSSGTTSSLPSTIEYATEIELLTQYKNYMKDPANIESGANYLLNSLIDETVLGLVFEVHHARKTGTTEALDGNPEDTKPFSITDSPDLDVFGMGNTKKAIDCTCPNCDRLVAASRFAPHLEKCMGNFLFFIITDKKLSTILWFFPSHISCIRDLLICFYSTYNQIKFITGMGRNSSRIASRRIANSRGDNNYFTTVLSDDEDDADWSGEKRRKKIQAIRSNGNKKNGKSS